MRIYITFARWNELNPVHMHCHWLDNQLDKHQIQGKWGHERGTLGRGSVPTFPQSEPKKKKINKNSQFGKFLDLYAIVVARCTKDPWLYTSWLGYLLGVWFVRIFPDFLIFSLLIRVQKFRKRGFPDFFFNSVSWFFLIDPITALICMWISVGLCCLHSGHRYMKIWWMSWPICF